MTASSAGEEGTEAAASAARAGVVAAVELLELVDLVDACSPPPQATSAAMNTKIARIRICNISVAPLSKQVVFHAQHRSLARLTGRLVDGPLRPTVDLRRSEDSPTLPPLLRRRRNDASRG
jgi:hypothetical protein